MDVDNECVAPGKLVSNRVGFITSPNYPALTQIKNRREACKWSISVPSGHYLHIVLHEVRITSQIICNSLNNVPFSYHTQLPILHAIYHTTFQLTCNFLDHMQYFVCVDVLRPSQPNGVMSSAVSLLNHTFTGQA